MANTARAQKRALVCGAGGFIGSHLVKCLKKEGYWVRGVDLKYPEFSPTAADDFIIGDLRDQEVVKNLFKEPYGEAYQLAADMGGAGFVFTGEHDADILHNSAVINLNILHFGQKSGFKKYSILPRRACIRNTISWIPRTRTCPRIPPIRRRRTASMVGKSCSANTFTLRSRKIAALRFT